MTRSDKLFRAIVVMGAALTAPGCDSGQKPAPASSPPPLVSGDASPAPADAAATPDAPRDAIAMDAMMVPDAGIGDKPPAKPAGDPMQVERVLIL